jgi:hypothetical protein
MAMDVRKMGIFYLGRLLWNVMQQDVYAEFSSLLIQPNY